MKLIQKHLIKRLVDNNGLKYAELALGYDYEDNVVYHIKHLIKLGYVSKHDQHYYLTKEGLSFSSNIYLPDLKIVRYKTTLIGLLCRYQNQVLLRKKTDGQEQLYRLPGTKPFFGESAQTYLPRIANEEIGLTLAYDRFSLNSIQNKIQQTTLKSTLFDNAMFVYDFTLSPDEYPRCSVKENNLWVPVAEIKNLQNIWPEITIALDPKRQMFSEYGFTSNYLINPKDL